MIIWITGQSGSGKTTLAEQMWREGIVILDGDVIRKQLKNTDLSKNGRSKHNIRVAEMAKSLDDSGKDVIVAVICPYKTLRERVRRITNCSFIYLAGGKKGYDYPYEYEDKKYFKINA